MARPRRQLDYEVIRRLASIGCTTSEIGAVVGLTREWISKRQKIDAKLRAAIEQGCETGRVTLRRLQWQGAQSGNPTMLIWLGKQLLGQRDNHSLEHTGKDGQALDLVVRFVGPEDEPK